MKSILKGNLFSKEPFNYEKFLNFFRKTVTKLLIVKPRPLQVVALYDSSNREYKLLMFPHC